MKHATIIKQFEIFALMKMVGKKPDENHDGDVVV
jgi:hypothetical protein